MNANFDYPEADLGNNVRVGRGQLAPRFNQNQIIENSILNVGKFDKAKRPENIKYVLGAIQQLKGFEMEDSYLKVDLMYGVTTEKDFHLKIMDLANGHETEIVRDPVTKHKLLVINLLKPRT